MRFALKRRSVSLAAALLFGALCSGATANSHTTTAMKGSEPADVQALLAAFGANQRLPADVLDTAWQVDLLGRQLALDAAPRLTFTERLTWQGFRSLNVELDVTAAVTLYRSNTEQLTALQRQRERLVEADAAFALRDAEHRFQRQLLALSLFRHLEAQLADATARLDEAGWRPPRGPEEALQLHPQERDLLMLGRSVTDLHAQVVLQVATLESEVATALGSTEPAPPLPSFDELLGLVAPAEAHPAACLTGSPLLAQLSLHHGVLALEHAAQAAPDVRLELFGSGAYRNGELNGAVGLELRVPLPPAAPLAGQLTFAADPSKLEQALRLSWPPPTPATRPQAATERAYQQADERAALEAEILELFRSLEAARAAVSGAELQLHWLVVDAHRLGAFEPGAAPELALEGVRSLSLTPAPEPFADLQRVRYLSELAFSQLAFAEQLLSVALVCGPST